MRDDLLISNDNLVQLRNLRIASDDVNVTGATVTGQLKTAAGVDVGGSISMPVVGSTNNYEGIIPKTDTDGLTVDAFYEVHITVVNGAQDGLWEVELVAVKRRKT